MFFNKIFHIFTLIFIYTVIYYFMHLYFIFIIEWDIEVLDLNKFNNEVIVYSKITKN